MKREIQGLIPKAIQATQLFLVKPGTNQVQKEYDGYSASLGAAVRNSGLLPALTFYTDVNRNDGSAARRFKLLKAVAFCLGQTISTEDNKDDRKLLESVIKDVYGTNVFNRQLVKLNPEDRQPTILPDLPPKKEAAEKQWKDKIIFASIALKLAMRNFEHTKEEQYES